ncbi:adenylate/guanylate cyclase domain-containing protein [Stappia indica]|uniref:adenylate/guanylate cyclase domain-containing protein n=1 Tax=Stappia indica TaxID=538381 RepID=UPI001D18D637|nr:adenylate/guanylate cyclase domain-containing protein [Stappia indica]MCC4243950.1 adenylate/guanylate cyclase domain-containing protein [Stappia indica]
MTGEREARNREPDQGPDPDGAAPAQPARVTPRLGWVRPLRVHLSTVIVALLLGISLPLTWLAHDQGTRLSTSAASQRMSLLGQRVAAQYEAVFNDGLTAVMLAAAADTLLDDPTGDMDGKALFLDRALGSSAHIDGLFVGRADSSFLHGVGDTAAWREALSAPPGTDHAVRTIQPAQDGTRRSVWRFIEANGTVLSRRDDGPTRFDPRRRPWYRAAVAADGRPVTVGPYTMATTGELGLTIAVEAPDEPGAVVGADVLLETLSDLLSREAVSPRATGYVFDDDRRLIVHSDPAMMAALLPQLSARARHTAVTVDDPLLPLLRPLLGEGAVSGLHRIEADGETYLLALEPVRGAAELAGTMVAVAAPLSDFTAESRLLVARALAVSFCLIVMGVLAALLVARLVSRSLTQLADDAARIGDLDLETRPPVSSLVAEINTLADALATARTAIASFALYVPRELVRKVVAAGRQDPASAERRDVTVLFTDIRDFTSLSEQNAPEEVVALLSDYFELLNRIVEAHDGVIVQYLGDSVCAMWNAPESNPDHVADACRCTLALVAAVDALNAHYRAAGRPELATRFGLHTGIAVVGSVGASTRRQYTAIGDTINVASRLEGMNKEFGTTVLTSEAVRQAAGDEAFVFRPLGSARAKGRAAEIAVYELLAKPETPA